MDHIQAKHLIYRFDSTRTGSLHFEDFIDLLWEVRQSESTKKEELRRAFRHFLRKIGSSTMPTHIFHQILLSGDRDFSEKELKDLTIHLNPKGTSIREEQVMAMALSNLSWVANKKPPRELSGSLTRRLAVRVCRVFNLEAYTRPKQSRHYGIEYETIDPMVAISCAGASVDTTVLIGQVHPEWEQELFLDIEFPSTDFFAVQRMVQNNPLTFTLYDYQLGGVVPHMECLGVAHLPLSSVLTASCATTPVTRILTMRSIAIQRGATPIEIEVTIKLLDEKSFELAELFIPLEDMWLQEYDKKIRLDLNKYGFRALSATDKTLMEDSSDNSDSASSDDEEKEELSEENSNSDGKPAQVIQGSSNALNQDRANSDSSKGSSKGSLSSFQSVHSSQRGSRKQKRRIQRNSNIGSRSGYFSKSNDNEDEKSDDGDGGMTLFKEYCEFYQENRNQYPHRHFRMIAVDENNIFRLLPCFVRPFSLAGSLTVEDAALSVSRIQVMHPTISIAPCQVRQQCGSMSLVLSSRKATISEIAILLCGLFLGFGLDAYVCVGELRSTHEPHFWVVVLEKSEEQSLDTISQSTQNSTKLVMVAPTSPKVASNNPVTTIDVLPKYNGLTESENATIRDLEADFTNDRPMLTSSAKNEPQRGRRISFGMEDENFFMSGGVRFDKRLFQRCQTQQSKGTVKFKATHWAPNTGISYSEDVLRTMQFYGLTLDVLDCINVTKKSLRSMRSISSTLSGPDSHARSVDGNFSNHRVLGVERYTPFDNIGCIFNHQNIWVNVQAQSRIGHMQWDLADTSQWRPFIKSDVHSTFGEVECWYSPPSFVSINSSPANDQVDSRNLLSDLVDAIANYRRNQLYIPCTRFHREVSKFLQSFLPACEKSLESDDVSFLQRVQDEVIEFIPNHTIWYGIPIHFSTDLLVDIMQQLESIGILDCSVPHALFTLAVQVFTYSWGLRSVWVYIGYIIDLDELVLK